MKVTARGFSFFCRSYLSCGKPTCHCAQADDPGHGPTLRLTYKVQGKTITEALPTPALVRKAEREITEFRKFQELSRSFLDVNEKICRLRPVGRTTAEPTGKKTADAIQQEVAREIEQLQRTIFTGVRKTGQLDLEAVEMLVRSAMHQAGASALSELLRFPAPAPDQRAIACPCGQQAHYHELRSKTVLTAVGAVDIVRPYYLCPHSHQGQFPADRQLDVAQSDFSPGVRRMQALVGQDAPFEHGREQMKLLAGLEVTTKSVERSAEAIGADIVRRERQEIERAVQLDLAIVVGEPVPILYVQMDGTGVLVVKKETADSRGKLDDLPGRTRGAKLGCVFTQTKWDEDGYARRDPDSTTYIGAIENAEPFGKRLYVEAWKRGWSRAQKKVVIGDGAPWIWNLAEQHFLGAIQIVDLFHARQHLWDLARLLFPSDTN